MIQLSKWSWWVLNQIDLKATAICTIIIARFLFTSQLVFQLHPFTPPSSPGTSIFLEGLLGSFFFTGFNWNLKKSRSQVDSELHQQHKGFRVALHILFESYLYTCQTCVIFLTSTFPSCRLFHRAISHQMFHPSTKEHDAHTFTSQSYPGGWIWQSFHFLDMFLEGNRCRKCSSWSFQGLEWRDFVCSHSWIVQPDIMSDYRTTWTRIW